MEKELKDCWCYEIIFDRYNKKYFFAEIYYNHESKPESWCQANLEGESLKELGNEIDTFFKTYINQMHIKRINRNGRLIYND